MNDEAKAAAPINRAQSHGQPPIDGATASPRLEAFTELAEALPQIVWFDNAEGVTHYVNQHWVDYTGLSRTESVGNGMRQAIHPADLSGALELWASALKTGETFEHELRLRKHDGEYCWHRCRNAPLHDPDGSLTGWFGTADDITDRRLVEGALRQSEVRFRSTFEQAAVGMAHVALDGRWLSVNNRLCEIVGYTREELLKTTFQAITHPDDLAADLANVQRLVAHEVDGYQMEKRYLRKNGLAVWINLTVSLQHDETTGEQGYFIVVVEDISERKVAEVRLNVLADASRLLTSALAPERRAQTLANLLLERLADCCLINLLRPDGQIELAAVAHRNAEQIQRIRTLAERMPLDASDTEGTPNVIRTGRSLFFVEVSERMLRHNPRLAALQPSGLASLIIVPLRARSQTLGAMTLIRSDPSQLFSEADLHFAEELGRRIGLAVDNGRLYQEAREAEAQYRQLSATLDQRVNERTAELERSNRELDQFAYVASHDLRAPLRAIDNLSAWIEVDTVPLLPPPSLEHLRKLRGRVQRMEQLLDDLLAYSRAGRTQHPPEWVDVEAMVKNVAELQELPPGFQLRVDGSLPLAHTVRVPLETVFRNLIGNAVKHHHLPTGQILVRGVERGGQLEFALVDDGPGIAPQFHTRIFEMFQTLQPCDEREGSGIGLAIVKKLVEGLGGTVWVESSEGGGAAFHFTWPTFAAEAEPTSTQS